MRKLLSTFILAAGMGSCMVSAHAQGWHHGGGHYVYRPGYGWAVPAVVGGIIGYELARPRQPEVVYVPTPVAPPPSPPYWRTPADMHWEAILDANCNCYKTVLVPNQ